MDIIKLKRCDKSKVCFYSAEEGWTELEESIHLSENNMRRLTPNEFVDLCRYSAYWEYMPCRVQAECGLILVGDLREKEGYGRYEILVNATAQRNVRFGSLAVKKE